MAIRLGEALMRQGVLTNEQVEQILERQRKCGRPFGALAEEMFSVSPELVEQAWAEQYQTLTEVVDPRAERTDPAVVSLIDRRQAWQFRILPLRLDGEEIRVATASPHLLRAMRFALQHFGQVCYFVIAQPEALGEALMQHFPMPGMTSRAVATEAPLMDFES